MNRRLAIALAVAAAGLLAVGVALAVALRGDETEPAPELRALEVEHCRDFADDDARSCYSREFLAMVDGEEDPRPAVARINDAARSEGGFLLENCHVVMHTVGRTYARDSGVTLATLMDHLPADNDPGCPAGFAHGLVTGVAPDIDASAPREAVSACDGAGTRFQRYSCVHGFGHAFMRLYEDQLEPALKLCTALGPQVAPDCAQGAYHDYWFAVAGADDAKLSDEAVTDPYRLCGAQPEAYVRPCWYRAFLETRPAGLPRGDGVGHRRPLRRPRGPAARGLRHRRVPHRPARPRPAAADLLAHAFRVRRRQLRPRHEGPEPPGRSDGGLRAAGGRLRALRARRPRRLLPLARQGARRAHRRGVRAGRLRPARRGRAAPVRGRRPHHGGRAGHLQLAAVPSQADQDGPARLVGPVDLKPHALPPAEYEAARIRRPLSAGGLDERRFARLDAGPAPAVDLDRVGLLGRNSHQHLLVAAHQQPRLREPRELAARASGLELRPLRPMRDRHVRVGVRGFLAGNLVDAEDSDARGRGVAAAGDQRRRGA